MSLSIARIAIVGGGLAGLVAAWRLAQHGVRDVVLFEARPSLGGRILSVDAGGTSVDTAKFALDRFDLGPTWFWPALQPQLDRVLATARAHIDGQRKRRKGVGSAIRRSIPVRTFADWLDPPPGFCEIDLVEHCGGPKTAPRRMVSSSTPSR